MTQLLDLGLREYQEVYDLQRELVARKKASESEPDHLILVEHQPVYTFGRKSETVLVKDPSVRSFEIERGGEATYHNPGQLVSYPILALRGDQKDVHLHLRRLEEVIILVLAKYGIAGERRPGATGVWIVGKNKKIASLGIAVSGWVTYHGSALNVNNDLQGFFGINPCGFSAQVMTSMAQELGKDCPDFADVKEEYRRAFSTVFAREVVSV